MGLSLWLPFFMTNPVRPVVLMLFILISMGVWMWEILVPSQDPADRGARWLLSVAVGLAFASEVFP
jgi:hypothetical protein